MRTPTTWDDEFPTLTRSTYLNTCSLGVLSRTSRQRVAGFHDEWEARGAAAWYDTWLPRLAELRTAYGALIGAPGSTIALHASVSTATAVVASTFDYARRPRVVTTSLDFPTLAYQWQARAAAGVDLVIVPSPDGLHVPLEAIAAAVDERTALVATSHVWFTTGVRQNIAAVADLAHRYGAHCLVDGYHAVGQIPVDVIRSDVDFYVGGGLKWLLGGPGIAFLYAREALIPDLQPRTTGWFAHADQFAFDPGALELAGDARRLEQGTPALGAVHTQLGGIAVLRGVGLNKVFERTTELTFALIERARERGLAPRVADDAEAQTAVVTFPDPDPPATVRRLAARQITVDARPGHIRVSPFFYNSTDDIETFLQAL